MAPPVIAARTAGVRDGPLPEEVVRCVLPGGPLRYILRRSPRARTVRVVVDQRRGAIVTVPGGRRLGRAAGGDLAARFVAERERWIRRHLDRQAQVRADLAARGPLRDGAFIPLQGRPHRLSFAPAPPSARRSSVMLVAGATEIVVRLARSDRRSLEGVLETWLRDRARTAIEAQLALHAPPLNVTPAAVAVRDQRSRWGSASRAGWLSFSWRLVLAPPEALETVVIHELAHLRVFGHGPRFWSLVAGRRPDHLVWRRWLRTHAAELHAALETTPAEDAASA